MQSPRTSGLTRISLLTLLAGMAGAVMTGRAVAQAGEAVDNNDRARTVSDVRKEFERLLPLWQAERNQVGPSSNIYDYWKGPHGKAIIALGPAIIPNLIQQLKRGDFGFNVPLALITKVDIATEPFQSEQAKSKLWVEWWEGAPAPPHETMNSLRPPADGESDLLWAIDLTYQRMLREPLKGHVIIDGHVYPYEFKREDLQSSLEEIKALLRERQKKPPASASP